MTSSKDLNPLAGKTVELDPSITVAVVGASGKMGTRVSNNLNLTDAPILYVESSEAGRERLAALGRETTDLETAAARADVVILAVPDVALGSVSSTVVPLMKEGGVLLTLGEETLVRGTVIEPEDVATVVGNLVDNAVRAAVEGSRDVRFVEVELLDDGDALFVTVADSGDGVADPESLFARGPGAVDEDDDRVHGRGFGLPLCREVAARRGGEVWLADAGGESSGAVLCARLPGAVLPPEEEDGLDGPGSEDADELEEGDEGAVTDDEDVVRSGAADAVSDDGHR